MVKRVRKEDGWFYRQKKWRERANKNLITVHKTNGKLVFQYLKPKVEDVTIHFKEKMMRQYNRRGPQVKQLIRAADAKCNFPDFKPIAVTLGDHNVSGTTVVDGWDAPIYSFCTKEGSKNYTRICPDFAWVSWSEASIDNYSEYTKLIEAAGSLPAISNKVVWRGRSDTHYTRANAILFAENYPDKLDIKSVLSSPAGKKLHHDIYNLNRVTENYSVPYMSMIDQVRHYRYFLDMMGLGFSARSKILFFSKRLLFMTDQPCHEYWVSQLLPWVHFVPVMDDLSDIIEKYDYIQANPHAERKIIENAISFAYNNLRPEHAINRWANLIQSHIQATQDR